MLLDASTITDSMRATAPATASATASASAQANHGTATNSRTSQTPASGGLTAKPPPSAAVSETLPIDTAAALLPMSELFKNSGGIMAGTMRTDPRATMGRQIYCVCSRPPRSARLKWCFFFGK